jgi:nucleoside diphosphate kinase
LNWDNIGLVICKPDAVFLNLEQDILSFLRQQGFQILASKYVKINPTLCRHLYWHGEELPSEWWWELEAEFFNLGESLCVLVQGIPEYPYKSVSELIDRKWKGNNKPEFARSGTIRRTFGASNRIFNIVHSSDCTEATKREAALFFSDRKIGQLSQCSLKQKEKGNLDIIEIYFRIKQHCIQLATIDSKVKRRYIDYIEDKKREAMSISNSLKQVWLFKTMQEEYHMFNEEIEEDILLECITDYENFKRINYDSLLREFGKVGLKLTKWEWCLLKTTMLITPKTV